MVLSVRGLTTRRVRGISFDVRAGEVVGLAGLIGAGRSEVAEAIFGADRALSGTVAVGGREIRLRSPADAIAAGIGFAPEDRKSQALLLLRSVEDNITLCVPDLVSRFTSSAAARSGSWRASRPDDCGSRRRASTSPSPSCPAATSRRSCWGAGSRAGQGC